MQGIVIVPHFFACSSYRPWQLTYDPLKWLLLFLCLSPRSGVLSTYTSLSLPPPFWWEPRSIKVSLFFKPGVGVQPCIPLLCLLPGPLACYIIQPCITCFAYCQGFQFSTTCIETGVNQRDRASSLHMSAFPVHSTSFSPKHLQTNTATRPICFSALFKYHTEQSK